MVDLAQLEPINGSWLLGYLNQRFSWLPIQDQYLSQDGWYRSYPFRSLMYVDDEYWLYEDPGKIKDIIEPHLNHIFIFKISDIYKIASTVSPYCVLFAWWHVVDDAISSNLLQDQIDLLEPSDQGLPFSCFNRRWTTERQTVLEMLDKEDLMQNGFITAINFPKFKCLQHSLNQEYTDTITGFERHNHLRNTIPISSTLLNTWHLNKHREPINISIETVARGFFPTEKSFQAFFTKRLPIVLAEPGRIQQLRDQGFDVFDDIIDHSYDHVIDFDIKVQKAINDNRDVLTNTITIDQNLKQRLNANYHHLTKSWLSAKLAELESLIENLLPNHGKDNLH